MSPILGIFASSQQGSRANSYESIATQTVGSGGASSITFSSIPSTYKHLQVRGIAKNTYTAAANYDNLTMQFNSDTGTNYARHAVRGNGSSPDAYGLTSQSFIGGGFVPRSHSSEANMFGAMVIDILDYTNTSKNTTVRVLSGLDENGSGAVGLLSGLWLNTAAITSITIATDLNNLAQYSSFALYGIK